MAKTIPPAPDDFGEDKLKPAQEAGSNESENSGQNMSPHQGDMPNPQKVGSNAIDSNANAVASSGPQSELQSAQEQKQLPSVKPGKFNLEQFRVKENEFAENAGGKKLLTTIPVRKPSKESWVRTHPDPNFRFPAKLIELKEQGEVYLVVRDLWPELDGESTFVSKLLVPVITRQQALLLWPIRLPGPDGRIDDWNRSALEAADVAISKWVRLSPNKSLGAYEVIVGPDPQGGVVWPTQSFGELLEIAFKGKIIGTLDHPVIRALRGQS